MAREQPAAEEEQGERDRARAEQRRGELVEEHEGHDQREGRERDEKEDAERAPVVVEGEPRALASALSQRSDDVHHRIGESPGDIAAERRDQNRARLALARLGDVQRADEGHGHQHAEHDLRDAVDRVKDALHDGRK